MNQPTEQRITELERAQKTLRNLEMDNARKATSAWGLAIGVTDDVRQIKLDMKESFDGIVAYFKIIEDTMVTKENIKIMATREDIDKIGRRIDSLDSKLDVIVQLLSKER